MRELDKINKIFGYAKEEAVKTGWMNISVDHFVLGIIRHGDNEACRFLSDHNILPENVRSLILEKIDKGYAVPFNLSEEISVSRELQMITDAVESVMQSPGAGDIPDSLVFLSIIIKDNRSVSASVISELGPDIRPSFESMKDNSGTAEEFTGSGFDDEAGNDNMMSPEETLEKFGYDLTKAAMEGRLDPVTGRDAEIGRAIGILCRRKKNNPLIVGEPGVGKTAIAEGIAQRIAGRNVPVDLFDKRIISLDMGSLVAGTKFRGDFEDRLKKILVCASGDPDIILFIDEIHNIAGAGGAGGAMDAASIMKPALSRGEFQCIGTTTADEYRKIIEKDGALARRFQKVTLEQPSAEMTLQILEGVKKKYEEFHNVTYSREALKACVTLSDRYLTDRNQPDKAIDLMDESGAAAHLRHNRPSPALAEMETRLQCLRERKRHCLEESDFRNGARLLKQEQEQEREISETIDLLIRRASGNSVRVGEQDILKTVSAITGIPAGRISASDAARMRNLREVLTKRIIGQPEAIDKVVRALSRNCAGLRDHGRPIGSFLFLGPTGVGKTHLAKVLAEQLFDSRDAVIRLDMSEYMEKISVSRLAGAPPGYVGYDDGGQLSERVRQKPYSVVLLDEIEKAHPDILNILLQILDEGHMTDSNGRKVNFRNTVIILTSNIGSRDIRDFGRGLGYGIPSMDMSARNKTLIDKALGRFFTPEFLNRLDETVYFNSLTEANVGEILEIELSGLMKRISENGYSLQVTGNARNFLCSKGYDRAYGARPMKRAVRRYLEDPIAECILSGAKPGSHLKADTGKDGTSLEITVTGLRKNRLQKKTKKAAVQ